MLNDFDSYNLTKLDVLDNFEEIQIGVQYKINGKKIDYMPSTIEEYAKVEVEYEKMPGYFFPYFQMETELERNRNFRKATSKCLKLYQEN
jgi:adenylosuccinate synthase